MFFFNILFNARICLVMSCSPSLYKCIRVFMCSFALNAICFSFLGWFVHLTDFTVETTHDVIVFDGQF